MSEIFSLANVVTNQALGSTIAIVVAGAIVGACGWVARTVSKMLKRVERVTDNVNELNEALVGKKTTALDPHPTPGLIARMDTYHKQSYERTEDVDRLAKRMETFNDQLQMGSLRMGQIESSVTEVANNVEKIANAVVALDHKVTPNGGDSNTLGDWMQRKAKREGDWLEDAPLS